MVAAGRRSAQMWGKVAAGEYLYDIGIIEELAGRKVCGCYPLKAKVLGTKLTKARVTRLDGEGSGGGGVLRA